MAKKVRLYTPAAAEKAQLQVSTGSGKEIVRGFQAQHEQTVLTDKLAQRTGPKAQMSAKRSPKTYKGRDIPSDEDISRTKAIHKDYESAGTYTAKTPTIDQKRILQRNATIALSSKHSPMVKKKQEKAFIV